MAFLSDVVSPILYPEGVSPEAVEKAVKLSKNLLDHIELHYSIFANHDLPIRSPDPSKAIKTSDMTALDLIHYHVYGDYRLCMAPTESDDAPEYLKTRFPTTQLRYKAITTDATAPPADVKANMDLDFLSYQMSNEKFDMLHGVMGTTGMAPSETEWFVRELAFGNSASKFHLPSLGTMAITNYAYKNINDVLAKALTESVELMMETIMFNRDRLPKALSDPSFDANTHYGYTDANDELKGNPLIMQIAKAITMNQEYLELQAQYPQVPDLAVINSLAKSAYKKDDSYEAAGFFCKQLLSMTNTKYTVGVPVAFKAGASKIKSEAPNYPDVLDGTLGKAVEAEPILASETFYVVDVRAGPVYDIIMETEYGEEFQINGVPEKQLQLSVATVEDEAMLDKARGKKGGKFTHPSLLVFQRIALDVIFSIEALIAVCTVPHKFYYISPKINTVAKQKTVANFYPKMVAHIHTDFDEYTMKNGKPTLEFLSSIRLQHTIANIANSEKLILDSRTMEEFYRQDLRMAETMWLASALTDAGKVVFEKTELPNLLAQMQYRSKAIDSSLEGRANIKPESVFYQIDSPILKDVIMQFDAIFVNFTVMNAFAPTGKKKKKGGGGGGGGGKQKQDGVAQQINALAAAVWGSIERRASEIVNRTGIKPHTLFNRLFSKLDRLNMTNIYIRDNYPPKWIGTNTVTLLRSPPEVLGEKLDMKFYTDCMDELIRHLKLLYKAQPEIPIVILQTITEVIVDAETDVDTLRESFIARIKSQAAKPFLKGTNTMFDPFRYVIMIMRTEIDIPLAFREDYVARKLDEEQKKDIKKSFSFDGDKVILPEDHPEFKEKEVKVDEESALYGLPNPYAMPLPAYYPKPGERLNTANPKVAKVINNLIGDPKDPAWPPNGFQIAVGIGGLTATESTDLKKRLLDPTTEYTALPIDWKGSEQIWDGRERKDDRAHPSVVAHFRETLGIDFEVTTDLYPNMMIGIVPDNKLTNYSSILYKKYLMTKYDEPSYVYIPAGGVFKNPSVFRGSKRIERDKTEDEATEEARLITYTGATDKDPDEGSIFGDLLKEKLITYDMDFGEIDNSFDSLGRNGTMIYKGNLSSLIAASQKLPEAPEVPLPEAPEASEVPLPEVPPEEVYDSEGRFLSVRGDDDFEIITREDDDDEPAPVNVSLQGLEEPINRLSSSVDLAASEFGVAARRFETASDSFESASGNFLLASQAYERSAQEFAKLPDAIKDGISQAGQRIIDKIEEVIPRLGGGDLEGATKEDFDKFYKMVEEALEGMGKEHPPIEDYREFLFSEFEKLFTSTHYNYKLIKDLKPLVEEDISADFSSIANTRKTRGQTMNWWKHSLSTAAMKIGMDADLKEINLSPKDREALRWRKYCRGILESATEGRDIFPMMGITPAD